MSAATIPAQTLVKVTRAHIDAGAVADCEKCPVALAVLDAVGVPGATVQAEVDTVYLWLPGEAELTADAPEDAFAFMFAFDGEQEVEPFEFTLTWSELETTP